MRICRVVGYAQTILIHWSLLAADPRQNLSLSRYTLRIGQVTTRAMGSETRQLTGTRGTTQPATVSNPIRLQRESQEPGHRIAVVSI